MEADIKRASSDGTMSFEICGMSNTTIHGLAFDIKQSLETKQIECVFEVLELVDAKEERERISRYQLWENHFSEKGP